MTNAGKFENSERELEIRIDLDKINRTMTISDSGIGMSKEEMMDNLGTIARSGSKAFMEQVKDQDQSDPNAIIGQFGVGFYSAFMVADKIEVFSKSSESGAVGHHWESDGTGNFSKSCKYRKKCPKLDHSGHYSHFLKMAKNRGKIKTRKKNVQKCPKFYNIRHFQKIDQNCHNSTKVNLLQRNIFCQF